MDVTLGAVFSASKLLGESASFFAVSMYADTTAIFLPCCRVRLPQHSMYCPLSFQSVSEELLCCPNFCIPGLVSTSLSQHPTALKHWLYRHSLQHSLFFQSPLSCFIKLPKNWASVLGLSMPIRKRSRLPKLSLVNAAFTLGLRYQSFATWRPAAAFVRSGANRSVSA